MVLPLVFIILYLSYIVLIISIDMFSEALNFLKLSKPLNYRANQI